MKLALFFTRNISLELWLEWGLFEREKLLYERHLENRNLEKVYWLTYGPKDAQITEQLRITNRLHPDIEPLPMPSLFHGKWGRMLYSFLMPLIHRKTLKACDILKTNQMDGSWSAVIAAKLYRKPLLVRTGYTLSLLRKKHNAPFHKQGLMRIAEKLAYKNASRALVTSKSQADYIADHYPVSPQHITLLPNYIDTGLFAPDDAQDKYPDRLIFVGRLSPEKNLFNLITALARTNLALDIYGSGELRDELADWAKQQNANVNFMGVVPNNKLPRIYNRYRYYILPSLYEGMPKTLLEAMACGLVCIATDVPGISEIIEDGVNGRLAKGTEPEDLIEAVNKARRISNDEVITAAVKKIRNEFSVESIVEQEGGIFKNLQHPPK